MIWVVFCSYLQNKRNIIRTHNSSWVILKKFEDKSLDISWVVSNLFYLSRLESIFPLHYNKMIETIENSVFLFRNPFSLLCKIIGFRHYFGDPYPLFQNGSNIPFVFCYFFLCYGKIIWTINSPCNIIIHFSF